MRFGRPQYSQTSVRWAHEHENVEPVGSPNRRSASCFRSLLEIRTSHWLAMPRFQRLSVTFIVRRICVFKRWGARCAELVTEANKGNEELAPPEPSPSLPSLPSVARPGLRNFTSFAPARWYERLWARCRTSRFTEQPPRVLHSDIAGNLDAGFAAGRPAQRLSVTSDVRHNDSGSLLAF